MVAFDDGLLDRAVHALDLARWSTDDWARVVRCRVPLAAQTRLNICMRRPGRQTASARGQIAELDAVVGEHGVDPIGQRVDQRLQKRP